MFLRSTLPIYDDIDELMNNTYVFSDIFICSLAMLASSITIHTILDTQYLLGTCLKINILCKQHKLNSCNQTFPNALYDC